MENKEGSRTTNRKQKIIMGYDPNPGSNSYSLIIQLEGPINERFELDVENHNSEEFNTINRCVIQCVCNDIDVLFEIGDELKGDKNKDGSGNIKKISKLIKEHYEREYAIIKDTYKECVKEEKGKINS